MASSMPIFSPSQTPSSRSRRLPRILALLGLACIVPALTSAQTLARPGWVGSGLTPNSWWRHAVIYTIDPHRFQDSNADGTGDLRGLVQRLDYLQSLGVDAVLIEQLHPPAVPAASQTSQQVIDPALGTLDDFDDLVIQASRHNIRVLIDLQPSSPTADLSGVARFWLSRGIAGFRLAAPTAQTEPNPPDSTNQLRQLRAVAKSYVGERILIGPLTPSAPPRGRPAESLRNGDAPQLLLNPYLSPLTQLDATAFRTALESNDALVHSSGSVPVVLTDDATHTRSITRFAVTNPDLDKVIATLLLTTRGASMVYFGQEVGMAPAPSNQQPDKPSTMPWGSSPPPVTTAPAHPGLQSNTQPANTAPDVATQDADPRSLLNWYRQLSIIQHSNLTLRSGVNLSLDHDSQHVLAWVRKPLIVSAIAPPIVFLCNLTGQPVQLSLTADMQRLHLRGSFLRTILRSDSGMGAIHLDSVTLPPFAVYIGELRY